MFENDGRKGEKMMKRILCSVLAVLSIMILLPTFSITASAQENKTFSFDLTVDGKDTKEVKNGDIVTVVLKLKRTDAGQAYTMHAMQDELRYDSTFLELVENSAVLGSGIVSTDIAMVDHFREFYMNYLSVSGGSKWEPETIIGSVQFKVIGQSGVTKITNQDCLVSKPDGSGSYPCDACDVTIILSTDCKVVFQSNGGSEVSDMVVQYGEKLGRPVDPVREGYEFSGWYTDIHLTDEWDFEKDVVEGNMSLYAKWAEISGGTEDDGGDDNQETGRVEEDDRLGEVTGTGDDSNMFVWAALLVVVALILALLLWNRNKKRTM